ncbi:MAG: DUF1697 domain-containing protein [Candidatus Acidiferrales bacterium]
MARYVAFLRAINVGGHIVKMDALRAHFEALGFSGVETFIASGNVIFETRAQPDASLHGKIESRLAKALGYEVATFLRTGAEVAAIAEYKAFRDADVKSAAAYCVGFLAEPLGRDAEKKLMAFKSAIDDFHARGREIFWLCKKRQSDSKFTNAAFERALGIRATFRGMNTIAKLAAKYPAAKK